MDEKQRSRYNAVQAETFDRLYNRFLVDLAPDVVERMERIVAAVSIRPGETVLDVGTGTGALLPLIIGYRPKQIFACDLSKQMLQQVAMRFATVERYQCDVQDLSLPESSVDVVIMNGMFGNIVNKSAALSNLVRMLSANGRMVISHPEGRAYVSAIARQEPFPITPLPSEEEAREMFAAVGMTLVRYTDEERLLIALAKRSTAWVSRAT